ncbi:unnamed protein product [Cylicocyclus nassatus]|uniref:Glycosyltransferase family 92 protein n=1 Tax=Cylicocyclus nassatus TaxID=53992 RepID=A0AA36GHM8_CYLNA|nr:unnamed protein product [Cylicocyclus nassatus]
MAKTENKSLPNHAKECISFYDLLQKGRKAKVGKLFYLKARTSLTPISAYAYSDYSVVTLEASGWFGRKVYCHYFDANWDKLNLSVESVIFPEHSVHCCRHPEAFYMGITENKNDEVALKVPVLDRTVDRPLYNLSVCLAPLYGNESKWLLLTELIEHHKLQGVQHFYVYVKDIDDYSRLVIDDYEKSGEIEVVYFTKEQDRLGMDWHLVGVVGEFTLKKHLPTLVFRNTSAVAPPGYIAKSVIDPRRVVFMHIHEARLYFPGYKRLRVPPDKVLIRHYRDLYDNFGRPWLVPSIQSRMDELKSFGNFTMTEYPTTLMLKLYKNVRRRLSQVYKWS